MKTIFAFTMLALSMICSCSNKSTPAVEMKHDNVNLVNYIQHTVMFNLKHESNSVDEKSFLQDAERILSALPSVNKFEVKKQVSPENNYIFYFSMYFKDSADYKAYNDHPLHVDFVEKRWNNEVTTFLEGDFISHGTF